MRILLLVNNRVGWQICQYLKNLGENIVGAVIHPEPKRRFGNEILSSLELSPPKIFDGLKLENSEVFQSIKKLNADIGISILFDYVLKKDFINLFPKGIINLHPSYLPFNRGQYPNVWTIVEETPSGVTLHYIDENVDTGDIIAQKEVPVKWTDTGETLYRRLELASVEIFKENWLLLKENKVPRIRQQKNVGTHHCSDDVRTIDHLILDNQYRARDLINIIRARTFPPYKGAYFYINGEKIYLRIELLCEDELEDR